MKDEDRLQGTWQADGDAAWKMHLALAAFTTHQEVRKLPEVLVREEQWIFQADKLTWRSAYFFR